MFSPAVITFMTNFFNMLSPILGVFGLSKRNPDFLRTATILIIPSIVSRMMKISGYAFYNEELDSYTTPLMCLCEVYFVYRMVLTRREILATGQKVEPTSTKVVAEAVDLQPVRLSAVKPEKKKNRNTRIV
ncbi:hypothetical protein K7432_014144 [Basidiobolus ranarum]|uniref:Uncharacterized protein n=1 Tax=Basidiobolus ranarum TaxID=34480 RepID=A0ABR2VQP4_9FUNG